MKIPFQTVDVFTDRKFGGNPLAMSAANATLDVMLAPGFFEHVQRIGIVLKQRLAEIKDRYPELDQREFDFSRDYEVINELGQTLFERAKMERDPSRVDRRSALLKRAAAAFERGYRDVVGVDEMLVARIDDRLGPGDAAVGIADDDAQRAGAQIAAAVDGGEAAVRQCRDCGIALIVAGAGRIGLERRAGKGRCGQFGSP